MSAMLEKICEGDKNGSQRTQWSLIAREKEQTDRQAGPKGHMQLQSRKGNILLTGVHDFTKKLEEKKIFKKTCLRAKRITAKSLDSNKSSEFLPIQSKKSAYNFNMWYKNTFCVMTLIYLEKKNVNNARKTIEALHNIQSKSKGRENNEWNESFKNLSSSNQNSVHE